MGTRALADRAGLSARAIRDIERGSKHTPRKDTVRLLAYALRLEGAERDAFEAAAVLLVALVGGGSLVASRFLGSTAGRFVVASTPALRAVWGEPATPSQFTSPILVAAGPGGAVYVGDDAGTILKLSRTGQLLQTWTLHPPTTEVNNQLTNPYTSVAGLWADRNGSVYVVDSENNRVLKLAPDGATLAAWGKLGINPGEFDGPSGGAADASGNVYVADGDNDRVQEFSPTGRLLALWGTAGVIPGAFVRPEGLAIDSRGDVYVADELRVQEFSADGHFLADWGYDPSAAAYLNNPMGLAVDAWGDLYAADNYRVVEFSPSRVPLRTWEPTGPIQDVFGVAIDPARDVVLSDRTGASIQVLSPAGKLLAHWGTEGSGPGQFRSPQGIAVDAEGNLSVVDTGNDRVETFSLAG